MTDPAKLARWAKALEAAEDFLSRFPQFAQVWPGCTEIRQALSEIRAEAEAGEQSTDTPIYDFMGAYMSDPECFKELDADSQVYLARAIAENNGLIVTTPPNPPEAGEQSGWRDIASAPRDGTEIGLANITIGHWGKLPGLDEMWETPEAWESADAFTHWQPLPASPSPGGR